MVRVSADDSGSSALVQKKYDIGAMDSDIDGDNTPYSGPTERSKVGWRDWKIFVAFIFVGSSVESMGEFWFW